MRIRVTLGKRIASGIILMLVLMAVVGGAGYYGLSRVSDVMGLYREVQTLQAAVAAFKERADQFMLAAYRGDKEAMTLSVKQTLSQLDRASDTLSLIQSNSTLGDEGGKRLGSAEDVVKKYRESFHAYVLSEENREQLDQKVHGIQEALLLEIKKATLWGEEMIVAVEISNSLVKAYFNRPSPETWAKAEEGAAKLRTSIDDWCDKVKGSDELRQVGVDIQGRFEGLQKHLQQYRGDVARQAELMAAMDRGKDNLYALCADLALRSEKTLEDQARLSNRIIIGSFCAALLVGILFAWFSTRRIVERVNGVIRGISRGAEGVSSFSRQLTEESRNLADGASRQAASIEETSSSLEEISSMVKQNAEHAGEAKVMMGQVKGIVDKVSKNMGDLAAAIDKITLSSHETDKIVKTIDGIAFQTNLLALNAAVEAARAGESGAGFAVVAGEVRNLAVRAAEAAKNTAQLIGDTIMAVKSGNDITLATRASYKENAEISLKIIALVEEIAGASREQAEGIEQVNKAVAEMDKLTQQNASGAEESASAAQEMDAEAGKMKKFIRELIDLVHGGSVMNMNSAPVEEERRKPGFSKTVSGTQSPQRSEFVSRALPERKPMELSSGETISF